MKAKIILILIACAILASSGVLIADTVVNSDYTPDVIEINRIRLSVENADNLDEFSTGFIYDFTVVNSSGEVLISTNNESPMLLQQRLNNAIANRNAVVTFSGGYIIVYTGHLGGDNVALRLSIIITTSILLLFIAVGYYVYLRHFLYRPFKKLKEFAGDIAAGNLDLNLPMDKDNLFGDFTESFDIMREELKTARQKIIEEEKSKKELIATLSHDIKTPVAIVRAASELLELTETDNKKLAHIKAIQQKTLEIDTLVTDLFTSSLEDLSELKVDLTDIKSCQVQEIIASADPLKKATFKNNAPDCLIKGDALRLSQVFGNIISNSYKYSCGEIKISFTLDDNFLVVTIEDNGKTLEQEEVPLLTHKFYRGKNASGKHGAGLGLYICDKLMQKMDGKLLATQETDGFKIEIKLALS